MRCIGLIVVFIVLAQPSVGIGQEEAEVYHERLEYDAATGKWIEIAPPIPGTDGGDLAIARFMLARGEYKKARKAFKLWFKMYPDSALRPQGLFYSAQKTLKMLEITIFNDRFRPADMDCDDLLSNPL